MQMLLLQLKMTLPPQCGVGGSVEDVSVMLSDGFICPQRLCQLTTLGPWGDVWMRVQEKSWELPPVRLAQSCVFCQTLEVGRVWGEW